ncbi:MAG: hypothetical protein ACI3VN_06590 [Candidatus Onthomonas sp.]
MLEQQHKDDLRQTIIPSDPEKRRAYITARLLSNELDQKTVIDFYDLADELFVSASTLKNDLKLI